MSSGTFVEHFVKLQCVIFFKRKETPQQHILPSLLSTTLFNCRWSLHSSILALFTLSQLYIGHRSCTTDSFYPLKYWCYAVTFIRHSFQNNFEDDINSYWWARIWSLLCTWRFVFGYERLSVCTKKIRIYHQVELKNRKRWVWHADVAAEVGVGIQSLCKGSCKCKPLCKYACVSMSAKTRCWQLVGRHVYVSARVCVCMSDGWAGRARAQIRVQTNWVINESNRGVVMGPHSQSPDACRPAVTAICNRETRKPSVRWR